MIVNWDNIDLVGGTKRHLSKAEREAEHKYTTPEMELILCKHFNCRRNLIVPKVSWAFWKHYEADIIVLSNAGIATELEIKVSASDLRKDLKKPHRHVNKDIHRLYFVIPSYLEKHISCIPKHAGILSVKYYKSSKQSYISTIRGPKFNNSPKWDLEKRLDLMRLSTMRVWSLKEKIYRNNIK